jgi:hypothetical protein
MLNEKGGINGRKIKFFSMDDAYSAPKAVEATRRLIRCHCYSPMRTQTKTPAARPGFAVCVVAGISTSRPPGS